MNYSKILNGAWEENGVIGTRVEITYPHITVLWRNTTVLKTTFKTQNTNGNLTLIPKVCGLRYPNEFNDYAVIKHIILSNDKLEVLKNFPISGDSTEILERTQNSRFGNYTIADEKLNDLQGDWIDDSGFFTLNFNNDILTFKETKIKIHILHSNNDHEPKNIFKIVNADPSITEVIGFFSLEYNEEIIKGTPIVFDITPPPIVFTRK